MKLLPRYCVKINPVSLYSVRQSLLNLAWVVITFRVFPSNLYVVKQRIQICSVERKMFHDIYQVSLLHPSERCRIKSTEFFLPWKICLVCVYKKLSLHIFFSIFFYLPNETRNEKKGGFLTRTELVQMYSVFVQIIHVQTI